MHHANVPLSTAWVRGAFHQAALSVPGKGTASVTLRPIPTLRRAKMGLCSAQARISASGSGGTKNILPQSGQILCRLAEQRAIGSHAKCSLASVRTAPFSQELGEDFHQGGQVFAAFDWGPQLTRQQIKRGLAFGGGHFRPDGDDCQKLMRPVEQRRHLGRVKALRRKVADQNNQPLLVGRRGAQRGFSKRRCGAGRPKGLDLP